MGRLAPGVSLEAARAELAGISAQLERTWPQFNKGCRAVLLTDAERLHKNKLPYILMGIVGLVLLIACANVAGLLLARASSRSHEIGLRLALGASRFRLVGQLMAESALIGAMGTAAGLLLARALISLAPAVIIPSAAAPYLKFQFRLDERVLAFTLLASLITVFVFGLVPALRASQSVSRAPRRARSRQVLVVVQMVLSIVLLASAGLLVRTFVYCMNLDPGFTRGNVLVADISPPYDAAGSRAFYEKLLDRARGMPGVLEATLALRAPLSGSGGGMAQNLTISGHVPQPGDTPPRVKYTAIGLNYFRTLGISLARGRDFDSHDQPDAARVMIVNFTMARQFWPNEDALGKTARLASDPPNTERTVVGVVSDTRINSIEERAQPYFYLPFAQSRFSSMNLIARTSVDPVQMARQVRAEVAAIDPGVPVLEITSMKLLLKSSLYESQVSATVVGSLGLVGLLLAAIGLYGVVSYTVAERTREIGIRMALGAQQSDAMTLILRQALTLTVIGTALGLVCTFYRQRAVLAAEREVDGEADQQPDEEPHPGFQRQRHHQHQAEGDGNHRQPGRSGHAESARRSGWVLRSTITPSETMMNANSVPMFARSANVPISQMPAGIPTTSPAIQVLMCGVLWTGCTRENILGSRPSRDMANQMRACPYWNTSSEESMPTMAPMLTHWRIPL
jgi:predicted permease